LNQNVDNLKLNKYSCSSNRFLSFHRCSNKWK